jgi:hypothetical protein
MGRQPDTGAELLQTSLYGPVNLVPLADLVMIVRYAQDDVFVGADPQYRPPGGLFVMRLSAVAWVRPENSTI